MIKARLKYILKTQKGKVPKAFSDDNSFPPYLSMDYLRDENGDVLYVKPKEEYKLIDENQVLVLWDGANAGEVMLSKKGFLSSTMAVVTANSEFFEKRFLFYFLKSIEGELKKASTGTTIPHLDQNFLFNTHFQFPKVEIQKPIADYLHKQCEKITRFIRSKQRFIELLKEQRQSIITHAVTKGIDENGKMKETVLGEIPEHWEVRRLKYLSDVYNGATPETSVDSYWGGDICWVTPVDFGNEKFIRASARKITQEGLLSCATTKVPAGSIIISTRAPIGSLGITDIELCTNQGCRAIVTKNIFNEFLYYFLTTQTEILNIIGNGTTFKELSTYNLKNLKIPTPTFEEQKQIVEHIKVETRSLDIAISKAEREIELIKEYREAMIAEAVTGKMKFS